MMVDKNGNDTEITLSSKRKDGKIVIKPSPNGDSRTKLKYCTREDIDADIMEHIRDVQLGMNVLAKKIAQAGMLHDKTKVIDKEEYIDLVFNDVEDEEFLESDWWFNHIHKERHHLNANCPVDVNFIDVMEMLVDVIMAGKGRKGFVDYNELNLDSSVLVRAYWNTVKLLDDLVVVK